MSGLKKQIYLLGAIALFGISSNAFATPVGTASITNCTPSGGVTVSSSSITWLPVAGTNQGCIATGLPTSISYSGGTFTSGTGTISDLPAGSTNPFMTLAGGVLDFSLISFAAPTPTDGVCSTSVALASGHSCVTIAGSPFLLISQGTSTAISLTTLGVLTDTGNASTSPYSGLFTTQLALNTAAIAAIIDAGGSITNTYSATLTTGPTVPEPATAALFGLGIVLLGFGRKAYGKR